MFSRLSMLAMAGAVSVTAIDAAAQAQPVLTQTCQFKHGPRAGQTIDFTGAPRVISVPLGNRCADMQGSNGVAVSQKTARAQGQGRFYGRPGIPSTGALAPGLSLTCRFTSGPRAGSTLNYENTLGAQPVPIGAPCADGPNSGLAVAPGSTSVPGM
jgi:hypothetical protein